MILGSSLYKLLHKTNTLYNFYFSLGYILHKLGLYTPETQSPARINMLFWQLK